MKKVIIYTDGSCLGNPGRGGWAAILCLVGSTARRELVGGARLTTNNRMELGGVIAALSALREACEIDPAAAGEIPSTKGTLGGDAP